MVELLVAVDGSPNSEKIVTYSCELAKKLSAKIILIYVSTLPDLVGEYVEIGGSSPSPGARPYVMRAEEVAEKLSDELETQGVPHEVLLESGDPGKTIVNVATERRIDMIVVGLRRLHGIEKIRSLGSVSRKVIETAPCPVVVVTGRDY
ncbi:MAG TPA: universal stress protein [Nitrososphaerales archaeon]|nr:universal stress protein [Nitrososphaerales archaeon]